MNKLGIKGGYVGFSKFLFFQMKLRDVQQEREAAIFEQVIT